MTILVHEPSGSLLLQAQDPFVIRDAIVTSQVLPHPEYNVAVKYTLEATKVLRNLGYDAPAPIRHQYSWPGKYTPFEHQVTMAEFLTLHRRAFNLSEMGCVDAATEYLTPTGWRRIDQYDGGVVAQYHPADESIEFVQPEGHIKLPCTDMIRIHTTRGVDQLLSPEHRVLLTDGRVVPAQRVLSAYGRQTMEARAHRFRTTFRVPHAPGVPLTDAEIRVQVAANADGWFRKDREACVRIKKPRKIERMRALLHAAGIEYRERPAKPEGFVRFSFTAPRTKGFDALWWSASQHQLEVIAAECVHWDGSVRKAGGASFYGTPRDAEYIQYAFSATGKRATIRLQPRCTEVTAKFGDSTIGLIQNNSSRPPNVRVEPSPDGYKYCFNVPSGFLLLRRNGCIFATGNSAKTNAALWAADWLMKTGRVRKTLVISPLSTLDRVWKQDIFDTLMHRTCVIVHGSREQRLKALAQDVDFYIINHDGIVISDILKEITKRPDIDLIITDEAGMFRNAGTTKYKALANIIANPDRRLWLLTGTPCPNAPTDAWALAKLVDPSRVPKYFGTFKRQTMMQIDSRGFKWVPRVDAFTTAYEAMQPAVRFKKADCIDLPPVTTQDHSCGLTKEQEKAFKQLRAVMVAEAKDRTITAVNAADQIGKLRQILCGSIKDTATGDYISIPHGPRSEALLSAVQSASAKVLVVCPFRGIMADIEKELKAHYTVGVLHGDVSPKARDHIIREFKTQADPHILLCHPKVMAHGLNLTEADTLIFYAPIYSNDEVQQVNERFNRAGQTRKMTIVRIGAHPLEWEIYKLVDTRKALQNSILDLYKQVTE